MARRDVGREHHDRGAGSTADRRAHAAAHQRSAPAAPAPVGFAEPAVTPGGLEVMSVLTKVKGGVTVTLVARDRGTQAVNVDTTALGPHDVTFRGEPVPMEMTSQTKRLVPGEALVYTCQVKLPDMKPGELSFTVAGIPVSGQAAGD